MTRRAAAWLFSSVLALAGWAPVLLAPAVAHAENGLPLDAAWQTDAQGITVHLEATDDVDQLVVEVKRTADGRTWTERRPKLRYQQSLDVRLPTPDRTSRYQVRVRGQYGGAAGTLEMEFEVPVLAPLDFELTGEGYKPREARLQLRATRPVDHVEVVVRGDTGEVIGTQTVGFHGEAAGTPLTLSWAQAAGNVLTLDVKLYATDGSWSSKQFIPWHVDYTVAGIHFATGSAEIPDEDHAMLDEYFERIHQQVERVKAFVQVELYVAGHTDTVGNDEDNRRLSDQRAQALARYFRSKGLQIPTFSHGFGESSLAKRTDDNVDESENRRAQCILSVGAPPGLPPASWTRLR